MKKRGRPEFIDINKVNSILEILYQYPDGVWIRQISRATKLPLSTVHYYLRQYFEPFIENIGFKNPEGRYIGFRLVRLKRSINAADVVAYIKLKKRISQI
jgi:hypothetical protein